MLLRTSSRLLHCYKAGEEGWATTSVLKNAVVHSTLTLHESIAYDRKPKLTINVLMLCAPNNKLRPECSHRISTRTKRPVDSCCLARLETIVNKDPFESSEACLFTINNANKAEVCLILRAKTSRKRGVWTRRWLGRCRQCGLSILQSELEVS